jgi:hypothetical protein
MLSFLSNPPLNGKRPQSGEQNAGAAIPMHHATAWRVHQRGLSVPLSWRRDELTAEVRLERKDLGLKEKGNSQLDC